MTATLAELEARVAALEAERADYRAVLAAINALAENQRDQVMPTREHGVELREQRAELSRLAQAHTDTNTRVRSIEDNLAEVKDLLVRALDRPGG